MSRQDIAGIYKSGQITGKLLRELEPLVRPGVATGELDRFAAVLLFVGLWMVLVYFPLAHMVWGIDGLMNGVWNADAKIKAIDFAGGTVVHMSSGWSALILCLLLIIGFAWMWRNPES